MILTPIMQIGVTTWAATIVPVSGFLDRLAAPFAKVVRNNSLPVAFLPFAPAFKATETFISVCLELLPARFANQ